MNKDNNGSMLPAILLLILIGISVFLIISNKIDLHQPENKPPEEENNNNNQDNNNNDNNQNNNNQDNNNDGNNNNGNNNNNNKKITINFSLNGSNNMTIVVRSKFTDPGFRATGSDGKDYSNKVTINGSIDTNKVGKYTIKYTLSVDGNVKTLTRTVNVVNKSIPVSSIKTDKDSYSLYVGDTISIKTTIEPSNATNKTLTWKSSDTSIATVSNGSVKGLKAGRITITIQDSSKKVTKSVNVVVNNKSITKNNDEATVKVKTVNYKKDTVVKADVTMKSNITPTIEYYSDSSCKVKKEASSVGTYYIIIKTNGNSNYNPYTSSCTKAIVIKEVVDTKISIGSKYYKVNKGKTISIKYTVTPTNTNVTWSSSNEKIAKVDSNGVVTGISDGVATITLSSGNKKVSTSIIVLASKEFASYTSNTLAYWIETPNSLYKITHIWVSDPLKQIKVAYSTLTDEAKKNNKEYPRNMMKPAEIIKNEIKIKGYEKKGLVAYNGSPMVSTQFYYEIVNKGYKGMPAIPLVLDNGKVLVDYPKDTRALNYTNKEGKKVSTTIGNYVIGNYIYGINKDGKLVYYKYKKISNSKDTVNIEYNNKKTQEILNAGLKYTFGFRPPLIKDKKLVIDRNDKSYNAKNDRNALCQVDRNNYIMVTNTTNIDGKGFSHVEMADLMLKMNCNMGVNLDGGGSISFYYKTNATSAATRINTENNNTRYINSMLYFVEQ